MTPPLYIFDLDGTLALIEHRRHFVERENGKKDWDAFHLACVGDLPNTPVLSTMDRLRRTGSEVRIWSGRNDVVRKQTIDWLAWHCSFAPWELRSETTLTMRAAGDYTPDDALKRGWLDAMHAYDRNRLVAAFDDRDRIVAMWRAAGVTCFQVAPGDF